MTQNNDLISRNWAIDEIKRIYCSDCNNYEGIRCRACPIDDALDAIEDAPAVDAEVVRYGEWIPVSEDDQDAGIFKCSQCGSDVYLGEWIMTSEEASMAYRLCFECGAKMRKESGK